MMGRRKDGAGSGGEDINPYLYQAQPSNPTMLDNVELSIWYGSSLNALSNKVVTDIPLRGPAERRREVFRHCCRLGSNPTPSEGTTGLTLHPRPDDLSHVVSSIKDALCRTIWNEARFHFQDHPIPPSFPLNNL